MTLKEISDLFPDHEWRTTDGFDDCVMGVVYSFSGEPILAYDYHKVIKKLMKDMSEEDAIEHFNFHIVGSYVGKSTPVYIQT